MSPALHQFVPTLLPHDAVGNIVREFQRRLRSLGLDSEIYVAEPSRSPERVLSVEQIGHGSPVIYHFGGFSAAGGRLVRSNPEVILHYHNITPHQYFSGWDREAALGQLRARTQLAAIAPMAAGALSVSHFNADELLRLGFSRVITTGTFSNHGHLADLEPGPDAPRLFADWEARGRPEDWLSVGRLVPHKAPDRVIAAFAAFRRSTGMDAKLTLIGKPFGRRYLEFLRATITASGVSGRVRLLGTGIAPGRLADHYRAARILVSASTHEGFGLPFLEAMAMRIPIVALPEAAIPETVGDAAVLAAENSPAGIAAAAIVASRHRERLIEDGVSRLAGFSPDLVWERIVTALRELRVFG